MQKLKETTEVPVAWPEVGTDEDRWGPMGTDGVWLAGVSLGDGLATRAMMGRRAPRTGSRVARSG